MHRITRISLLKAIHAVLNQEFYKSAEVVIERSNEDIIIQANGFTLLIELCDRKYQWQHYGNNMVSVAYNHKLGINTFIFYRGERIKVKKDVVINKTLEKLYDLFSIS